MYGFFITAGILLSLILGEQFVKTEKLSKEIFWKTTFWALISGVIGARFYYVIENFTLFLHNPLFALMFWKGGMVIIGGLIAGFLSAYFLLKKHNQDFLTWTDTLIPVLPLAQAIGRWGNYFNKELLPFAIYEMFTNLITFGTLLFLRKKYKIKGLITYVYLAIYSLVRFLLEPYRKPGITTINLTQAVSIAVFLVSLGLLWKTLRKEN